MSHRQLADSITDRNQECEGRCILLLFLLAYLGKMPANFVHLFLLIRASSKVTRTGIYLVYPWKEAPAGFYRLNVTMTRDRIFHLKKCPFLHQPLGPTRALFPAAQRQRIFRVLGCIKRDL